MKTTKKTRKSAPITWIDPGLLAAAAVRSKTTKTGLKLLDVSELLEDPKNARTHDETNLDAIRSSFKRFKQRKAIVVQRRESGELVVRAGNGTVRTFKEAGWGKIVALVVAESDRDAEGFALADNRSAELAGWDADVLAQLLSDQGAHGFDAESLGFTKADAAITGAAIRDGDVGRVDSVAEIGGELARFRFPPISILDARGTRWRDRREAWIRFGVTANEVRFAPAAARGKKKAAPAPLPPIGPFDPVLCELVYRWFGKKGGTVYDPFAGGCSRGIVASTLGQAYKGIDCSKPQLDANRASLLAIAKAREIEKKSPTPLWIEGDSAQPIVGLGRFDLVFSAPPRGDATRYSDDVRDLSTLPWTAFLAAYRRAIASACKALRDNRFAVFVVGEIRGKDGNARGFVSETIRAFEDQGLALFNDAVFIRDDAEDAREFGATRRLARAHDNVLVFLKGDAETARAELADVSRHAFDLGQRQTTAGEGDDDEVDDGLSESANLGHDDDL